MKILLAAINAKYIHSNPAVYSLAAYAGEYLSIEEKEQCRIEIAEYTINHRVENIYGDIYKKRPDIIGFSCYIWNWEYIQEIITELSKLLPGIKIYLGGPEVSFTAEKILQEYPFLQGIMEGEGEELFLQLCKFYSKKENENKLPKIEGIITPKKNEEKKEEEAIQNSERKLLSMDQIPFIYKDMKEFANRIVYYESSRGCPYRCSYCLSSIDKQLRFRSLDKVKEELKFFLDKKVKQVKFIDRTFNCNRNHALEIWKYLLKEDNGITNFHFEVSADLIREEELELFKKMRPGLIQLEIGVQSTNPATIKEIDRTMDLAVLQKNVAAINSYGNIHQHLDLIAGLPFEDYETFKHSFNQVYEMEPNQLQLGFLKVLKGAKMWRNAKEYGLFYTTKPPYEVLYTKWISYEEILRLKRIDKLITQPYPGFPTDLQALAMALLCCADGISVVTESLYENRFMHVPEFWKMGANIIINKKHAIIKGVECLVGTQVESTDLRAGAALVLAGLNADGETIIKNSHYITRGYFNFVDNLNSLGANIKYLE